MVAAPAARATMRKETRFMDIGKPPIPDSFRRPPGALVTFPSVGCEKARGPLQPSSRGVTGEGPSNRATLEAFPKSNCHRKAIARVDTDEPALSGRVLDPRLRVSRRWRIEITAPARRPYSAG